MNQNTIFNSILTFILFLYPDPVYPRKIVQVVIEFMNAFIKTIFLVSLKEDILKNLRKKNVSSECLREIEKHFENHSEIFSKISTEHKRFQLFRTVGFIDYEEFEIGNTFIENIVGNDMLIVPDLLYGIDIPLRKSLKCFLEIPKLFDKILEYVKSLGDETYLITNIMQADLWVKNYAEKAMDEIILPLYIFYDDLEVGNPLGNHAGTNKFGILYASVACLPLKIASKLNSIIFSTIIYSEDKKNSDSRRVFQRLIHEINFLQIESIKINVSGIVRKVKFQLILILGDNLGLNSIFGYTESFNANMWCRICRVTSTKSQALTVEDENELRNIENYNEDIKKANMSETGIKEPCVFNEVNNFHITKNLSIDLMHDLLEGVCVYVMQALLFVFVFEKKYFILQSINCKIKDFDFGSIEDADRPPQISFDRLKKYLKLTKLCFVRYFSLIIGDMIPENDEHWKLYLLLRQIIDIVTTPRIVRYHAKILKGLIKEHNELYMKLFKTTLKPKFHNMIHYPRILLENGPVINFWCMRYESRHRQIKGNAQSTNCSKNLLKTIATKQALKFCEMANTLNIGNNFKIPLQGNMNTECEKGINVNGFLYKVGSFIVTNMDEVEKQFGKITEIFVENSEIYFLIEMYNEINFYDHRHAYLVNYESKEYGKIKQIDLPVIAPCLSTKIKYMHFIASRYIL